jgi:hypothetical protein
MKLEMRMIPLLIGTLVWTAPKAVAVVFPDQVLVNSAQEDENEDAVSRFGSFKAEAGGHADLVLHPISESSFDSDPGRAPASIGSRGPAAVKTSTVKIQSSDAHASKRSIVRKANQGKAFQEVAIIAKDTGFYPSTLFLTQGIGVRIYLTGASQKAQCFMLDSYGIRRQISSRKVEEVVFTPDHAGTFTFHCPMNGAKGTLVVKELEIGERVPASVSVSQSMVPVDTRKSEIEEADFTPEFRKP